MKNYIARRSRASVLDELAREGVDHFIQVGAANDEPIPGALLDNENPRNNISGRPGAYGWLTAFYHLVKNIEHEPDEIVGFCTEKNMLLGNFSTYTREMLDFLNLSGNPNKKIKLNVMGGMGKTFGGMLADESSCDFSLYDFMIPRKQFSLPVLPVKAAWALYHDPGILENAEEMILKQNSGMKNALESILTHSDPAWIDQAFIGKWKDMKEYGDWLFEILLGIEGDLSEEMQKRSQLAKDGVIPEFTYDAYYDLSRVLLNVWLLYNKKICMEKWEAEVLLK